ncbi:MAG: hypothetical protein IJ041_07475 [Clostridia bacterium]|nr:hypothetical protein [Clostridia bacterium]
MNVNEIYQLPMGSRVLLLVSEGSREEMIGALCAAMPEAFRRRADLNENTLVTMDMTPDSEQARFSDLSALCSRLVTAAGRRSHFEGLLLLNISELMDLKENTGRLKALGELLAMPDGLASRCTTVLYGPRDDREMLLCADLLDADGCLVAAELKKSCMNLTLDEMLQQEKMICQDRTVKERLLLVMAQMNEYKDFVPVKFLRSCRSGNLITRESLDRVEQDPLSYMNRICRRAEMGASVDTGRRIGFGRE